MGFEWFGLSVWLCVVCGVCCAECWLGEGRGEGWFGVVEKPISKTFSSKRSHIHHHAQSPSPALCTPAFSTTRKPRLPLAFPPQTCAVACCPSRHGKEAQSPIATQGLKRHVEMHSTGLLQGQVPDQWPAESPLHVCPVCSRIISSNCRPC